MLDSGQGPEPCMVQGEFRFLKKGGRSVERRKALTSLGVGVELEWEAGRGNPTPHGLGVKGRLDWDASLNWPFGVIIVIFQDDLESLAPCLPAFLA